MGSPVDFREGKYAVAKNDITWTDFWSNHFCLLGCFLGVRWWINLPCHGPILKLMIWSWDFYILNPFRSSPTNHWWPRFIILRTFQLKLAVESGRLQDAAGIFCHGTWWYLFKTSWNMLKDVKQHPFWSEHDQNARMTKIRLPGISGQLAMVKLLRSRYVGGLVGNWVVEAAVVCSCNMVFPDMIFHPWFVMIMDSDV